MPDQILKLTPSLYFLYENLSKTRNRMWPYDMKYILYTSQNNSSRFKSFKTVLLPSIISLATSSCVISKQEKSKSPKRLLEVMMPQQHVESEDVSSVQVWAEFKVEEQPQTEYMWLTDHHQEWAEMSSLCWLRRLRCLLTQCWRRKTSAMV